MTQIPINGVHKWVSQAHFVEIELVVCLVMLDEGRFDASSIWVQFAGLYFCFTLQEPGILNRSQRIKAEREVTNTKFN